MRPRATRKFVEAALFVDRVRSSPDIDVIDDDRQLFDAGLTLYRERLDKTYSHVDCMAMVICKRENITEILTGDRDFQREGFTILLWSMHDPNFRDPLQD